MAKFELNDKTYNKFEKNIRDKIEDCYTIADEKGLQNLAVGISNLFDKTSEQDKKKAINFWNDNVKDSLKVSSYVTLGNYKEKVYTYYEYIQFKRARFDCTSVEYNSNTGRIIEMNFKFNGSFN